MPVNLRGRSLLSLDDLSASEFRHLLKLAKALKTAKLAGNEQRRLEGRNIALIFEKDSTRTRSGFEVAAYDQGAHVTYLGPSGSQIGHKESMKDTARVLGRMYDAIEFRGYSQGSARELAAFSGVPVYNGLTDEAHPTQTLADVMTMREFSHKHLSSMKIAFVGDIANNVARSLASGALKLGMDMRLPAYTQKRLEPWLIDAPQRFGDPAPPSWRTVATWVSVFVGSEGEKSSLRPAHENKGNRETKIDPIVIKVLQEVIQEYRLARGRINYTKAHKDFVSRIEKINAQRVKDGFTPLKPSSYRTTVNRFQLAIPP